MAESKRWYIRTGDGSEYGPADMDSLVACARDGRIDATCFLSADQAEWIPATTLAALGIQWICETQDGQFAGPFHKDHIAELIKQGTFPATIRLYRPDDPKKEAERAKLADELAAVRKAKDAEVAAERTKGEQLIAAEKAACEELAAQLKASQEAVTAAEAKNAKLADELKTAQEQGKALSVSFAEAQRQSLDLATKLTAANKAKDAEVTKVADLQDQIDQARTQLAGARDSGSQLDAALKAAQRESSELADKLAKFQAETAAERIKREELIAAEKAKCAELAAQLKVSREAIAAAEAKGANLADELKAVQTEGKALSVSFAEAQKQSLDLATKLTAANKAKDAETAKVADLQNQIGQAQKQALDLTARLDAVNKEMSAVRKRSDQLVDNLSTANKEKDAESAKVRDLQTQLEDAERKIKELQKPKKPKNPLLALFGKDSTADLSALEQAARRELSAMKRPRGAYPRPFKSPPSDIIDV